MSSNLSIPGSLPTPGMGGGTVPVKAGTAAPAVAAPAEKSTAPWYVNPDFRFDPSTGLVVIEFHNDSGQLTNSIPSQRQLDAYRLHQTPLPGEAPAAPSTATPVALKTAAG
jgi:hypothetical protein